MAQERVRGDQLDIQDFSNEVANDTTSIALIANGLITDAGAIGVFNEEYIVNLVDIVVNASAVVDVFIYDTSLDDDGGAWIDKANKQSWYLETLNTSIRGSTRPFPKLVVIVTETDFTIIYDGTDSTLPMWMVIPVGAYIQYGSLNTSRAKNGVVYNCSNAGVDTGILGEYHFIDDEMFSRNGAGKYIKNTGNRIVDRNTAGTDNTYVPGAGDIVNNAANDIAITSDGNMGNIVGVATDAGVTRIAPDDTTSHWNDESNTVNVVECIDVDDEYFIWSVDSHPANKYTMHQSYRQPLVNSRYYDTIYNHYSSNFGVNWANERMACHFHGHNINVTDRLAAFAATNFGVTKFYDDPSDWGGGMIAHISDDFNSGVQVGDIRGAWLASSDSTSMTDTEHLTDPTFDTACGVNWTCDAGWSISAGQASHTGAADYILSEVAITAGDSYLVTVVVSSVIAGTLTLANMNWDNSNIYITITGAGTYTANIPRSRTDALRMHTEHDLILDSVSVIQTDQDRSYNNSNITTHGTVARSAVNTGAELMGYNPSTSSGLFIQQHNTDLDFGTGDFHYMLWVKMDVQLETRMVWHKHSVIAGSGYGVDIRMDGAGGYLNCALGTSTGIASIFSNIPFKTGTWAMISFVRRDGNVLFYLDDVLQGSDTNTGDVTNALATLNVGALYDDVDSYSQYWNGQMALLRIGASAPSREQLTKIYNEEKPMFQENAKCLLQGLPNVNAIDYDQYTDIITACSDDRITKFKGLVVVDDRAEVATSISTVNEMEMTGV